MKSKEEIFEHLEELRRIYIEAKECADVNENLFLEIQIETLEWVLR